MSRWITRKDVDGRQVKPPIHCYDETSIVAVPGLRTVEQCVRILLAEDEQIVGGLNRGIVPIQREGTVVGYLEIQGPQDPTDSPPTSSDFRELSIGELRSKMRNASNILALLGNPGSPVNCSEEERARILAMSIQEQAELRIRATLILKVAGDELQHRTKGRSGSVKSARES
jgi:hypothetical protein